MYLYCISVRSYNKYHEITLCYNLFIYSYKDLSNCIIKMIVVILIKLNISSIIKTKKV